MARTREGQELVAAFNLEAQELVPNRSQQFTLADECLQIGEYESAALMFEELCRQGYMPFVSKQKQAVAHMRNGDFAKARRAIQLCLDSDPDAEEVLQLQAELNASVKREARNLWLFSGLLGIAGAAAAFVLWKRNSPSTGKR